MTDFSSVEFGQQDIKVNEMGEGGVQGKIGDQMCGKHWVKDVSRQHLLRPLIKR